MQHCASDVQLAKAVAPQGATRAQNIVAESRLLWRTKGPEHTHTHNPHPSPYGDGGLERELHDIAQVHGIPDIGGDSKENACFLRQSLSFALHY